MRITEFARPSRKLGGMVYINPSKTGTMAKERKNCPKDSEITVGEWLDQIGATQKFVGSDGEGPPDYEIRYKGKLIAVEVTLLHDTGGWEREKEIAFERELRCLIEEVSQEGGPRWHARCEYDSRVSGPPSASNDAWKTRARKALLSSGSGGEFQLLSEDSIRRRGLGRGVMLGLIPASNEGSFTGVSSDKGCLVGPTLSERLVSIVDEKATKVQKGKRSRNYNQWWLILDDEVLIAPFAILTAKERTEIDTRVRECDGRQQWNKIVMVSRFQTRCDGSQEKWFYAPWEDPRHPSLPESPSPKVMGLWQRD